MRDGNRPVEVDLGEDRLGALVRCIESRNPFLDNRINGPSAHDVDVDGIHQAAFTRLTRLAREACESRRGVGVVLWGEAGIGKSHLLSRLARWARRDKQACFAYLHNLQAAPERLPRSLLHSVVNSLTNGRQRHFVETDLFDLIHASLREALDHKLGKYTWSQLQNAYERLAQRLGTSGVANEAWIDRSVWKVFFHFFRSAYRTQQGKDDGSLAALALRWLSGQTLDPDEARRLELPPPRAEESVALLDNQQIKQVLAALTCLAAVAGRPFVLVFDQVDNLDEEQAAALARFLEALIDSSSDLLVVTAGVKDTLLRWHEKRVIQESAWDRLAQENLTLQRLKPTEATAIIEARLQRVLEPFTDIELVQKHRQADVLFPLGETWRGRYFGDRVEIRPRDAINWARQGWREQQEAVAAHDPLDWLRHWPAVSAPGPGRPDEPTTEEIRETIDRKISEKLASLTEQLVREPHTLPLDADHLAGLVYSLLAQCRDAGHRYDVWEVERVPPPKTGRPTYHLALRRRHPQDAADLRIGLVFLLERSANAACGFLRRLLKDLHTYDRVVAVTAESIGLPLGQAGREYLEDLERRGPDHFQKRKLTFHELVELEVLQRVIGLARSNDLEIEPIPGRTRSVTEQEVIEAYLRHGRYLASPLLRGLLQERSSDTPMG